MLAAVAKAAAVPEAAVRRAQTLAGDLGVVARSALTEGADGLAGFGLQVGTPLAPMLAGSAPTLVEALDRTGPAGVEWKLDGIRVQLHRDGDDVRIFTRSLEDITDRMPEVVDGGAAGRARPGGARRRGAGSARRRPAAARSSRPPRAPRPAATRSSGGADTPLTLFVFDALHLGGHDLLDEPGAAPCGAGRRRCRPNCWCRGSTSATRPTRTSVAGPRRSPPTRWLAGTRASW